MISKKTRAELILVLTTLIWGGTFALTKNGLSHTTPFLLLTLRFGTAGAGFILIFFRHFRHLSGETIKRALFLSLFFFSGYAAQTIGLKYTSVAKSSLLTYVFAVFTPFLQFLILKKRVQRATIFGLGIVMAGMFLITSPAVGGFNPGDYITLAGAVGYSFYIIFLDIYSKKEDPIVLTGIQFAVMTILSLGCSFIFEKRYLQFTGDLAVSLLYLAVGGSIVAIYLMNKFQKDTTPAKAVIIYALEPVFSIIFGYILLREILGIRGLIGGILIIAGILVSELAEQTAEYFRKRSNHAEDKEY